jgi:hypothetical protein
VRNRNRCRTPSQSGLNLKYSSGLFPREQKEAQFVVSEELHIHSRLLICPGFGCFTDSNCLIRRLVPSTCV